MANVGQCLQQARLRARLSLSEISARTKIRVALLDAIEREEFERLPRGLLTRGFLRAYAREVGLDPESIVRQFQEAFECETVHGDALPAPATAVDPDQKHRRAGEPAKRPQFLAGAVAAALAAVVFILLNPSAIDDRMPSDAIATTGAEADAGVRRAEDSDQVDDRVVGSDGVAIVSTSQAELLRVDIAAAGLVWVEATADGVRVLYQLIQPDNRQVIIVREELLLRIGDAGAFRYSINGVPGHPVGPPGAVRSIRITRENYATFQHR